MQDMSQPEETFKELQAAYSEMLLRCSGEGIAEEQEEAKWRPDDQKVCSDTGLTIPSMVGILGFTLIGCLAPELFNGKSVLHCMLAEKDILKRGGWACERCTCVNESGNSKCRHCGGKGPVHL
mmetsp:Transcript_100827/g.184707  ORF Transcript_100827/g.184707 Transcript_100827/m.184707 type:complete len:123 (-) Transcript_100827:32-400(-)